MQTLSKNGQVNQQASADKPVSSFLGLVRTLQLVVDSLAVLIAVVLVEVVYVEKDVTVDLDFFSCKIFLQIWIKSRTLDLALIVDLTIDYTLQYPGVMAIGTENYYHRNYSS